MKLEPKNIIPYLPYGLRLNTAENIMYLIDFNNKKIESLFRGHLINIYEYDVIKPILRPLSDITKEINHKGERLVPIEWFRGKFDSENEDFEYLGYVDYAHTFKLDGKKPAVLALPYCFIEKLLEWHFDVFNLIPNGLAIDINTLNQ